MFVKRLVEALRSQAIEVTVVQPQGYESLTRGAGLVPNLKTSWRARMLFPFYCLSFWWAVRKASRGQDVIHANWSLSGLFAVLPGSRRLPKVLTERSPLLVESENGVITAFVRFVARRCNRVVTISESARKQLARKLPELDISVIPNGIDTARFNPSHRQEARGKHGIAPGDVLFLAVGRLTKVKRLDELFDALESLPAQGWQAAVIGDGELREHFEERATGPQLHGRVRMLGRLPHEQVADWMNAADVMVLRSMQETGGNVVLEAMSSGAIPVSTPVGWANDFVVHDDTGFLVPVDDVEALGDVLRRLVKDEELRQRLARAGRSKVDEAGLTWQVCARRYKDIYQQIMVSRHE